MTEFIITPLPSGEPDPAGLQTVTVVSDGSYPCRRCLTRAAAGEHMLLLSYDPFTQHSPYAGPGPVYIHTEPCQRHRGAAGAMPAQVAGSLLSLRGYDERAMLVDADVVEAAQACARVRTLLDDGAAFVHVHFARPGCFAFRVDGV